MGRNLPRLHSKYFWAKCSHICDLPRMKVAFLGVPRSSVGERWFTRLSACCLLCFAFGYLARLSLSLVLSLSLSLSLFVSLCLVDQQHRLRLIACSHGRPLESDRFSCSLGAAYDCDAGGTFLYILNWQAYSRNAAATAQAFSRPAAWEVMPLACVMLRIAKSAGHKCGGRKAACGSSTASAWPS